MINIKILMESNKLPSEPDIRASLGELKMPLDVNSPSQLVKLGKFFEGYQQYYKAAVCYAVAAMQRNIKGYHCLITVLDKNEHDVTFCDARLLDVNVELCQSQSQQLQAERMAFLKQLAIQRRIQDLSLSNFQPLQDLLQRVNSINLQSPRADKHLDMCQQVLFGVLLTYKNHLSLNLAANRVELENLADANAAVDQHDQLIQAIDVIAEVNKDNCEEVIALLKQATSVLNESNNERKRLLISEIDGMLSQLLKLSAGSRPVGAVGALLQRHAAPPAQPALAKICGSLSVLKAKTDLLEAGSAEFHDGLTSYYGQLDEVLADVKLAQQKGLVQLKEMLDTYYHNDSDRVTHIRSMP